MQVGGLARQRWRPTVDAWALARARCAIIAPHVPHAWRRAPSQLTVSCLSSFFGARGVANFAGFSANMFSAWSELCGVSQFFTWASGAHLLPLWRQVPIGHAMVQTAQKRFFPHIQYHRMPRWLA